MYAKYVSQSGASRANVVADIVAILSGTTDKTTLSADCVQASTEIIATGTAAGWTVHDATVGTNKQVIKAPFADDATKHKYLLLDFNTNTSYLYINGFEDWDATAHTGTNQLDPTVTYYHHQYANVASYEMTFHISASARHMIILTYQGTTRKGTYSSAGQGPSGIFERSRMLPWDTVANGYPPFVWCNIAGCLTYESDTAACYTSRIKLADGTEVARQLHRIGTIGIPHDKWDATTVANVPRGANYFIKDATGNNVIPLMPLFLYDFAYTGPVTGEISSVCDIWVPPTSMFSSLDEITYNANPYIYLGCDSGQGIFVRKD